MGFVKDMEVKIEPYNENISENYLVKNRHGVWESYC